MTIKELFKNLQTLSYKELFGDDEDSALANYRKYAIICHPDTCKDELAKECFELLGQRKNEHSKPPALVSIKGKSVYSFDKTNQSNSDFTTTYFNDEFAIKVSKLPKFNILLKNEAERLNDVYPDKDSHFNFYLPKLVESFAINQVNKVQLQANVFNRNPINYYSLEQIKHRYPNLDGRNAAWILNRLFEILGYVHSKGIIHANIVPSSFLIDPISKPVKNPKPTDLCHGGILINWENAAKLGETARFINKKYKTFFPVEVLNKQPLSYETDIYMLGSLAKWLCQDFPKSIERFFSAFTINKSIRYRPDNCFELYQEFRDLLVKSYGPPKFVSVDMF